MFSRSLLTLTVFTIAFSALTGVQAQPLARLSKRYKSCRPHVNGTETNAHVSDPPAPLVKTTPIVALVTATPTPTPTPSPKPLAAPPPPSSSEEVVSSSVQSQVDQPSSGNSQGPFHGEGTHYAPGLGACGKTSSAAEPVVALSHLLYDTFPGATPANTNLNPICGRKVKVTWKGGEAHGVVVDRCEGCAYNDIDMSLNMWEQLKADPGIGRLSDNIMGADGKPTVSVDWVWE